MSGYDSIILDPPRERSALPVGKYGNSTTPELHIVHYNGVKPTKTDDLNRHSFLVAGMNGVAGTAFLAIQVKDAWLNPEAVSLAFGITAAELGTTEMKVATFRASFLEQAAARAVANNTPPEALQQATQTAYDNLLTQIRINVGTILRLQDWAGQPRNPQTDWQSLVGTEFAGSVEAGLSGGTSDIKSVYSRKRVKM